MSNKKKSSKPINPKSIVNSVTGLTSVQETQRCKQAIRHVWRKTSRVKHIRDVRFQHPDPESGFTFAVKCVGCETIFGQSEKVKYKTKHGKYRRTGAYEVNHIGDGMPSVTNLIEDLGGFADKLLHTPLEILCPECHKKETAMQVERKRSKD